MAEVLRVNTAVTVTRTTNTITLTRTELQVPGISGGGPPTGPAGGVLGGTYPDPGFAADPDFTGDVSATGSVVISTVNEAVQNATGNAALRFQTGDAAFLFATGGLAIQSNDDMTITAVNGIDFASTDLRNPSDPSAGNEVGDRDYNDGRYQGLDADLTAIAALATTAFGRALLTLADQAALLSAAGAQAADADLTALAAANNSAVLAATTASFLVADETKLDGIETGAQVNPTTEVLQDLVGAMVTGGTETGVTVTYDDTNGRLDFVVSITASLVTDFAEAVSDQVGTMVTGNTESGITVAYQDSDNTLDFTVDTASETVSGISERATDAEVLTGTDTTRYASPASIAAAYLKKTRTPGSLADDTWDGPTATLTAAENLVIGDVCYINSSSKMAKADADAAGTAGAMAIALATINTDASGLFGVVGGFLRDDSAYAFTPGQTLYLSTTPGGVTATAPSGTGDQVQVLGYAYSADVIWFAPSPVLVAVA